MAIPNLKKNNQIKKIDYHIALIGNPNSGKSTVFNALSGARQKTGNYPGVTVEKKTAQFSLESNIINLTDLPGTYGLKAIAKDEQVVSNFLMGRLDGVKKPNLLLVILDATAIKRNLYLFSQAAELHLPLAVVLTMNDLVSEKGIKVDVKKLSEELDCDIFIFDRISKQNKIDLQKFVLQQVQKLSPYSHNLVTYNKEYLSFLEKIKQEFLTTTTVQKSIPLSNYEVQNILHFPDDPLIKQLEKIKPKSYFANLRKKAKEMGFWSLSALTKNRYAWAQKVFNISVSSSSQKVESRTSKIDRVLVHRFFGLIIFASVMFLVFQSIYTWSTPLMDGIEFLFGQLQNITSNLFPSMSLNSFITDGIIGGVGSVIIFLPQIIILFFLIALLEDSGYMSRAAFLMDKLLSWTGLSGRSFVPLLSSFACAIPGIMSARSIEDEKSRITTILISPLMSCSARLPVYVLLISAFIEPRYGIAIATLSFFLMHLLGVVIAMPLALFFNRGLFKSKTSVFSMEMPLYRKPSLRNVYLRTLIAAKSFIKKAGTTIFILSMIIWVLTYFPRSEEIKQNITKKYSMQIKHAKNNKTQLERLRYQKEHDLTGAYLENSYLGSFGKAVQPLFAPLGFDWKLTVGILGAFPAREVIISTLGIIYNVGSQASEESKPLKQKLLNEKNPNGTPIYTTSVVLSLLVFFALCAQCMSTLATIKKELNSYKWPVFVFVYLTSLAYIMALIVYQGGLALGLG